MNGEGAVRGEGDSEAKMEWDNQIANSTYMWGEI